MTGHLVLMLLIGGLNAVEPDWIAAGNRALDNGSPEEAAADFAHALGARVLAGERADNLLSIRVTLATAYLQAGEYRKAETVLQEAQKTAWQLTRGLSRAELLNAWSALHLKIGQVPAAEVELLEARRIVTELPDAGDLMPAIYHNLAAVEMRTGEYAAALRDERDALHLFGKMLGPDHPTMIRGWASMASLEYLTGQPQDARQSLERAIAASERTYGPSHPLLADLLESDAIILDKLKLKKEANRARTRARKIRGGPAPVAQDPIRTIQELLTQDVRLVSK